MLKHYFKSAIKGLLKKKLFTFINIFALAVSLAMCMAVLGHLSYELSFEDFHENGDRIYRVEADYTHEGDLVKSARVMGPMGKALIQEIPEVEYAATFRVSEIRSLFTSANRYRIDDGYEGAGFVHGDKLIFADPEYLKVFSFSLRVGDPEEALAQPFSALITEEAAEKYFPEIDPVGQTVTINRELDCHITGILEDIPQNTQLHCDFMISYSTLERVDPDSYGWDNLGSDYAYVVLNKDADPESVVPKISSILNKHLPADEARKYEFRLKPLGDIYFDVYTSGNRGELHPGGEASMIFEMGIIAVFVLILAIANFINLSTARSADRMKEVGVRKVMGAARGNLIRQFLGESVLISVVSMLIGIGIYELFKIWVSPKLPREMFADFYNNPTLMLLTIALVLIVGVLAGYYPALYLSRFKPIAILQSRGRSGSARSKLRKVLVVFQFTIAIMFICSTVILIGQFNLITSIDLGFDRQNMLVLEFEGDRAAENCQLIKNEILARHQVIAATAVDNAPGVQAYSYYGFYADENRRKEDMIVVKKFHADYDFLSTFGLEMVQGRWFSPQVATDETHGLVVNESTAAELGVDNPVGHILYGGGTAFFEIIGVVKDFQGSTLDFGYKKLNFIGIDPQEYRSLVIKIPGDDIPGTIAAIKQTWESVLPEEFFLYTFLDDDIAATYDDIHSQKKIFLIISAIAIFIACLGTFGLVSYTAERRTKEIGIRKVLGASVAGIVTMLSREFLVLIAIANAIGWPCAYLLMSQFLAEFPFRVSIGIGTFLLTGLIALALALFSAGFQSVKAAVADPVDSLRCE